MVDSLRLLWGWLYWNLVKARFVSGKGSGRCPCQSPSDSGRAGETRCEAAMGWDEPARFRRVCPALRRGPGGWRCSVDTADVRPHWGRAAAGYSAVLAFGYLFIATAAWAFLVARGYDRIAWADLAVPSRWGKLGQARRDLFMREAMAALERRDVKAMRLSLASASAVSGSDYEARLAIAQIEAHTVARSTVRPIFDQLLLQFPGEADRTAFILHDILLIQGQFDELARFALQRAGETSKDMRMWWLQVVVSGLRGSAYPARFLSSEAARVQALPPRWAALVRAWIDFRSRVQGKEAEWLAALPSDRNDPGVTLAWYDFIAEAVPVLAATDAISGATRLIGSFHRDRLLFRVGRREGVAVARAAFGRMLGQAREQPQRAMMLASLVEFPDPACIGRLLAPLQDPAVPFAEDELGGVWVAAVRASDGPVREAAERRLLTQFGRRLPSTLPRSYSPAAAEIWSHLVPMDRHVVAALSLSGVSSRGATWQPTPAKVRAEAGGLPEALWSAGGAPPLR